MLKQKFFFDFSSKIGIYLVTAISGIIVTRIVGPEVVGALSYANAYVTSLSFIASLFGGGYIKLISEGQPEEDCNKTYLQVTLVSLIIYCFVILSILFVQKTIFDYKFGFPEMETIILITLISFVIGQIYNFNEIVFNARMLMVKSNLPTLLKTITFNFLRVIFVFMGFKAIGLSMASLIASIIFLPLIFKYIKQLNFGTWNNKLFKRLVKVTIPLSGLTIIEILINNIDKIILEYYSSITQVGYYSAAYSIGGMLLIFSKSSGTIFYPLFSEYISKKNYKLLKEKIKTYQRFFFVFIQPLIISLIVFSESIIVILLGYKYKYSGKLLSILLISVFFSIWGIPIGNIITGAGEFKKVFIIHIYRFISFIFSIIFFLHFLKLEAIGIAITTLVQNIILFILFLIYANKIINENLVIEFYKYFIVGIILTSLYYFCGKIIFQSINDFIKIFIIFPLSIFISYLIYYLLKLINKNDFLLIKNIFNLKQNKAYFKSEL